LFEICWNSKGLLATDDWDYQKLSDKLYSFISSGSSSSFSPMLWETVIDEEFEKYGALGVKGEYSGANGMAELLCNVVKHFDTSLFTFRHCILDEFMVNNDVCNLLEVYPKFEPDLFSKIEKHKTSWNRNISHHGGEYKKYQIYGIYAF